MELNIKQLFLVVMKKLPIIMVVSIILGLASYIYTEYFVTPLYSSSALLSYQSNENRKSFKAVNSGDYTVSVELVSSIPELIKNDACIDIVARTSGLDAIYSNGQIRGMISLSSKGTENFTLTASCPNREHSLLLVNAFAKVISNVSLVDGNIVEAESTDPDRGYITKIFNAGTVTLISEAKNLPSAPSSPNMKKNILLGFLIGFVFSSLFFIAKDFLSAKVITEEDIDKLLLEIPALGSVPMITTNEKGSAKK